MIFSNAVCTTLSCVLFVSASPAFSETSDPAMSLAFAKGVAERSRKHLEHNAKQNGIESREARGYALLIAAMIGSAALTTYLSASLPHNFQFLSQFLAQVSTLGVYVLGAPIWEPIGSHFRKFSFGVRDLSGHGESDEEARYLNQQWGQTQKQYSLNEQMSRGVLSTLLNVLSTNFNIAREASLNGDVDLSTDQIAEAAYRQRLLFRDVDPHDRSLAAMVWTTFTNKVTVDADFRDKLNLRLKQLDAEWNLTEVRAYYDTLIEAWLTPVWLNEKQTLNSTPTLSGR